ncbi:MAG: monovalent cation/H(+) antiporter subunit G [Chloroflexi bacterium]|nr:monovalent cation/H(+) antiporter subunit G [Chloroflexota bacterium]
MSDLMGDVVTVLAMLLGSVLMLLSGVGIVRMPDVYMRLQVASKASSLGAGLLMLAVAAHFAEVGIVVRSVLVVAFIFLTTPVSAHLLGRAAYLTGVPLWDASGEDALGGAYDPEDGTLAPRTGGAVPGSSAAGRARAADEPPGTAPHEGD